MSDMYKNAKIVDCKTSDKFWCFMYTAASDLIILYDTFFLYPFDVCQKDGLVIYDINTYLSTAWR